MLLLAEALNSLLNTCDPCKKVISLQHKTATTTVAWSEAFPFANVRNLLSPD